MRPYKQPRVIDLLSDGQHDQVAHQHPVTNLHSITDRNKMYTYDHGHPSQQIQQKIQQYSNRTKQKLEIYEFLRQNNILDSNTPVKISKCKVCSRKVENDNNKFKCGNCKKSCHIICMQNTHQCPRCCYNDVLKIINKPTANVRISSKSQKMNKKPLAIKQQKRDENAEVVTRASQKQTKQNVVDTRSLPKQYHQQALQFTRKYYKYLNDNGDLEFPIQDKLIYEYKFIQHLLKQKPKDLSDFQPLPEYFGSLVEVWNFFSNLETIIKPRQLCEYSLQIFQEVIKTKEITYFVTPILQLLYQMGTRSGNATNIFKLLENINENNMLKYVCKYFWVSIILQYVNNYRGKQTEKVKNENILEKLTKMQQKRAYQVTEFSQKIDILKFLVEFTEKTCFFRSYVNEYIKLRAEQSEKAAQLLEMEKQKLKEQHQQNAQKHVNLVLEAGELKVQVAGGSKKEGLTEKLLSLEETKKKVIQEQQQIRQQLKKLKQDSQTLGYLSELRHCNKIFYLGKDRRGLMYWLIDDTQATNIIFVSQTTQDQEGKTISEKWGFYHGNKLEELLKALNVAGTHQSKLRLIIEKLINVKLIQMDAYRRISRVRQILKNIRNQAQDEREGQNQQVQAFFKNNIKQINLSELRKLLVESLRLFNIYVKRYRGIWEVNHTYEYRTKNERFKNLNEIKQFVIQFGTDMYGLKQSSKCKKNRGRQKRGSQLWSNRPQAYTAWKKSLQEANKNSQVFMLALILYIEVVFSAGEKKVRKQVVESQAKPKFKPQKKSQSSKSSKSNEGMEQSWSGSRECLMEQANDQSSQS